MPTVRRPDGSNVSIDPSELTIGPTYPDAAAAKAAMVAWVDALLAQIMAQYPAAVRDLWPEEERMARAYLASPRTATVAEIDTLTQDAETKGRTVQEHCEIVVQKADDFRAIGTVARRLFLETEQALQDAAAPEELEQIIITARATAVALAANYGLSVNTL